MEVYLMLKNLIEKKFYKTKEIAQSKVNTMFLAEQITEEQYLELTALVNEKYAI